MGELKLQFLGEIRVLRGGEELVLPPSRKTRGLLAYLALSPRSFRREQLCELLWEIPDDPRGSLRWSLSKLRRLVDDEENPRIIADRTHAAFEARDADIDVIQLLQTAGEDLQSKPLSELKHAAEALRGEFLEGLELPNFHEFYAWQIGRREEVGRAQAKLYSALALRLGDNPEEALPYAQSLASCQPQEEEAHTQLIRLLLAAGRKPEAEQQLKLARHLLEEAGILPGEALKSALRSGHDRAAAKSPDASVRHPMPASRGEAVKFARGKVHGRDREIRELIGTFNRVCETSRAGVVLLRGEPGIGKSRLLQFGREVAQQVDSCLLEADAFESEIVRPFALWKDALRRNRELGAPLEMDEESPVQRDRLFSGLSHIIREQAQTRPVIIIFDDLQWCDESSAAALHYILRMNTDIPLFVLAAGREAELRDNTPMQQAIRGLRHDGLLQEFSVGALPEAAICALIVEQAPSIDAARLASESAGNPLLAIELARAEVAGAHAGSLAELVRERLDRLGTDAAELLMWASVLAPNIDSVTLEKMSSITGQRLDIALHSAEEQGMLMPADRGLKFSHDLICRSVYEEIPTGRRQAMHRRVAERLEVDTAVNLQLAADLAHHAAKSGDPALAARAMVAAGRLCLRFYANEDALNLALTGLDFARDLPDAERVCLTLELNDIRVSAGPIHDWEAAASEFVDLAEQALDHGALPYARLGYHLASSLRWKHGHWTDAQRDSLQAERVTRGASDEEHILGMAETAKCLALLERDLHQADAMLMEASALAQRKRVSATAIPVASGILRYYEGRFDEADELLQEARTRCKAEGERVNEFQANEYLLMIEVERGDMVAARDRCAVLASIGEKLPEGSELHFSLAVEALLQYFREGSAPELDKRLQGLRDMDAKHRLSYVLNRLAQLNLERGEHDRAIVYAEEALSCTQALGRASEMVLARTILAQAYAAVNREVEREQQLAALEAMMSSGLAHWARIRAGQLLGSTREEDCSDQSHR